MSNIRSSYGLVIFTALALSACGGGGGGPADSITPNPNTAPNPTPTNFAPLITGSLDATAMVGETYKFKPSASDPNGDALVFSVLNQPAWMGFSSQTGELTGTPQPGDEGRYVNIVVGVSDGQYKVELPAATVQVEANIPPQFANEPTLLTTAGVNYSFVPLVIDPDSTDLEFSVQNLPVWARFDALAGAIRGVPSTDDIGNHNDVSISVTDGVSTATLGPFTIVVFSPDVDLPPVISGTPALTVVAGDAYSFTPDAADPEASLLLFGVQNPPQWASFDPQTGALTGTPGIAQQGNYSNIIISVTDGVNTASLDAFDISVLAGRPNINTVPTISGVPSSSVVVGMTYDFTPQAADADGDALSFSIQNRPAWTTFNTTNGRLIGIPSVDDIGDYAAISVSVTDGFDSISLPAFTISVSGNNTAPVISGSPNLSIESGMEYSFVPTASDADGDTLSFTVVNLPSWATFSTITGELSGVPAESDVGTYSDITITVSDGTEAATLNAFTITITSANSAPQISGSPSLSVESGVEYSFIPTASDADEDTLSFTVVNRPSWATFSNVTGELSGVPAASDVGTYSNIAIIVSDGTETAAIPFFKITVTAASAPQISGSPKLSIKSGAEYSFVPTASDAQGDTLSFTVLNLPSWATFSSVTGELSGVPAASDVGTYAGITITVSDGTETAALPAFTITVTSASAPQISGSPKLSIESGAEYSFVPTASDAEGDTLSFTVLNLPSWATFSSVTGELSGVPAESDVGTYAGITITVSDGTEAATLNAFTITVTSANRAPLISGSPSLSVESGIEYSFVPTASDADGDTLSFTVLNRPSWATFSSVTGELSGVPAESDVGTYAGITITVSDGSETAALNAFTITVTSANTAPLISGTADTMVTAGSAYTFTPSASDADGDALTFSIVNKPSWAAFDLSTGGLSGTPDSSEVGIYSNIAISVSDGEDTESLAAFSIEVADVMLGSITLSWTPPTEYEDGAALNDLAGYRINYGTMPGDYTSIEDVNVGGISTYVIENLAPDTYYIALTVVNSTGVTSAFSEEVTVVVTGN